MPAVDPRLIKPDWAGIQNASQTLQNGGLVAFPSETVYGLGADATDDRAVARIYSAKGRPSFNPLIVHVASIEAAQHLVRFDDRARLFADKFCPGALSLVLPRLENSPLSLLVSAGLDSVAIRIPSHPIAHSLLAACQIPIAAPSANPSGAVSPTSAQHVLEGWPDTHMEGPKWVLDDGACQIGVESTVLDLTTPIVTILRPGGISREDLQACVDRVDVASSNDESPQSPGMLSRHYSPETPLYLNEDKARNGGAYLGFGPPISEPTETLSATGNLEEAAANLFAMLRRLDAIGVSSISVAPVPNTGLGLAINDRLRRAASP